MILISLFTDDFAFNEWQLKELKNSSTSGMEKVVEEASFILVKRNEACF